MRKGTRSCFECRRRKLRCVYKTEDSVTCIACKNRGSHCTEQTREKLQNAAVDSRSNLKDRVRKLEAIIDSLVPSATETPSHLSTKTTDIDSISSSPGSAVFTSDIPDKIEPLADLFNNAIWLKASDVADPKDIDENDTETVNLKLSVKRIDARNKLLALVPAPDIVHDIIKVSEFWWHTWDPLGPWLLVEAVVSKSLEEFVLWTLHSDDPAITGLGLLCIAVSVQQLDGKAHQNIIARLGKMPGEAFQEYFETVEKIVICDSDFACTRTGVAAICLSSTIFMNLGLVKKSWLRVHQAISYSQILGLHRFQSLSPQESNQEKKNRYRSWVAISESDAYLSLLLGLPYASNCRSLPASIYGPIGTISNFRNALVKITVRIIERNEEAQCLSTQTARDIQEDLTRASALMPPDTWTCYEGYLAGNITRDTYLERINSKLWLHQLEVYLHMPLMIQSVENPDLEYHRLACLEASRDLLKTYHTMRLDPTAPFSMVQIIDYQAFLCATILLLGVLGYGSSPCLDQSKRNDSDRTLVYETVLILRKEALIPTNIVAIKALQGLESLKTLAQSDTCPYMTEQNKECPHNFARIVVPYSGTVTISPGRYLRERTGSSHHPSPVFTISNDISPLEQVQPTGDLESNSTWQNMPQENTVIDVPSINFDLGSMNMNAEFDWSWLNDVNGLDGLI